MKLQRKINLFLIVLLGTIALALVLTGYFVINQIIIKDSTTTFSRELANIDLNIQQSHQELVNAGLISLQSYVNAEKERLLGILRGYQFGATGQLYVLNLDGHIVLHKKLSRGRLYDTFFVRDMLAKDEGSIRYHEQDIQYFAVFKKSSHWNWLLVLAITEEELYQTRNFYLTIAFAVSAMALFIVAFFSIQISRAFQKRLHTTLYGLQQIENGDLEARITNIASDEIGEIQSGINSMVETVASKTQELETANKELQSEIVVRKRIEGALKEAKDEAETANKAKSMFLTNMSHELRTPLNAVLGFSQLMSRDAAATDVQRKNLGIINRSGDHLLAMINDILDLSKIEAGKVKLEPEAFDLHQTLNDIGEMIRSRTQAKGLHFLLELDDDLVRHVQADIGKLRQILINLLGNAVKFTDEGGVVLRARTTKMDDITRIYIEVEDTGPGIPADQLEAIFEPFVQAGAVKVGRKGTGLGLSITRSFVKLMGGILSVESEVDKGSVFRVELPIEIAEAIEITSIETPHRQVIGLVPEQPQYRILVVEDDEENLLLLETLLTQVGFIVQMARNGKEAIDMFQQWQPHFIWMDMRMPVMDGYEATQKIRALADGKEVKILALTASAFKEQHEKILAAGCDDVVHKPYKAHEIFDAMAHYLDVHYLYEEGETRPVPEMVATKPSAEALARLPTELLEALQKTARSLDMVKFNELLEEVATLDPTLRDGLAVLVSDFRFDEILKLCNAARDKT